ncbi:hypothetical protein RR48_07620 [Papilio machaon]|uniref:Uncharacterized protein n=1 Tax=Papilio machaon TaxID=76193 RepID=A0A194QPC6_PAPMA|nr:hypothetical protein RR48_07620 [Papilio machaon]
MNPFRVIFAGFIRNSAAFMRVLLGASKARRRPDYSKALYTATCTVHCNMHCTLQHALYTATCTVHCNMRSSAQSARSSAQSARSSAQSARSSAQSARSSAQSARSSAQSAQSALSPHGPVAHITRRYAFDSSRPRVPNK